METNNKTMLNAEIQDEFSQLAKIEVGTDPYKITVDGLTKLMDRAIELEKIEAERDEKMESLEREERLKLKQMQEDRIDRFVKHGITVVTAMVGFGLTVWGTKAAFEFEKTGTISTSIGRLFFNRIVPKN